MSNLAITTLVSDEEASPEVAEVFQQIREGFQIDFVPNFFRAQAVTPHVLKATWVMVDQILVNGPHLPRALKEMMFVAISRANKCSYCESAHLAFCKMFGVDEETQGYLLAHIEEIRPERARDMILFAVKVAAQPSQVTEVDYQKLRDSRVSEAEMGEAIAMGAFASYANALADGFQIPIDEGFRCILAD